VRGAVREAAARCGRDPAGVRIGAVTKTVAPEAIALLPGLGVEDVGENRVQEAATKQAALAGLPLRWHMVGRIQTNKARRVAEMFHRVHSVDRHEVMEALDAAARGRGRALDCLLQVNVSGEATKGGFLPAEASEALDRARAMPGLRMTGLMAVPAPFLRAEDARPAFRLLRELRDGLRRGPADLPDLGMGMSADYPVAVEEGATLLRIGSAIFEGLPARVFGRAGAHAAGGTA